MKKTGSPLGRAPAVLAIGVLVFSILSCASGITAGLPYRAGKYSVSVQGFGGTVTVTVTTDRDLITKVAAAGPRETAGIGSRAIELLPPQILNAQSTDVDVVAGATVTSRAVLAAATGAIARARGEGARSAEAHMQSGIYTASAYGFNPIGKLAVSVTVDETNIQDISVIDYGPDDEPMVRSVIERMIPRMIRNQSLTVDSISGATASSNAVKAAVSLAVAKALKAGGSESSAISAFDRKAQESGEAVTLNVDVLVVGMGGAGCAAAMSAAETQAEAGREVSVLAIDKAGKFGGASAFCVESMGVNPVRFKNEVNGGEDFVDGDALYSAWIEYAEGDAKEQIVRKFLDNSGDTLDWLSYEHGFIFNRPRTDQAGDGGYRCGFEYLNNGNIEPGRDYGFPEGSVFSAHRMADGFFRNLIADYEKLGGRYMLETEARELLYDKRAGTVIGVRAVDAEGTEYVINAKAIILATGGFAGNGAMEQKYFSEKRYPLKGVWEMLGMRQSDGRMIQAAFDVGAGSYNIGMCPMVRFATSDVVLHEHPVNTYDDARIDSWYGWKSTWSLNDVPHSLVLSSEIPWVDKRGRRFANEGEPYSWWKAGPEYYAVWSRDRIDDVAGKGFSEELRTYALGQGGVPAGIPVPQIRAILDKLIADGVVLTADTPGNLAKKMRISANNLTAALRTYEEYCRNGEDKEFGKDPAKLKPMGTGPYYAIRGRSACFGTCAALNIDADFNVLKADGKTPIRGLYAVGNDSGGVLYTEKKPFVPYRGAALGWAFTSGRLAGVVAARAVSDE